jgi:hypothetical protein
MKTRVQVMIVMVAVFLTLGLQQAQSQRIVTATETTGLNPDFTSLFDSAFGLVCGPSNEDATACFGTPYNVASALINPNIVVAGGADGVDIFDSDGNLSDQLFLTVGPQINGMNLLTWCWDSDMEPNINICPHGTMTLNEPPFGRMDLTGDFNGLLAAGSWQITALSESPEPSTFLMMGSGLLGLAGVIRRKLTL